MTNPPDKVSLGTWRRDYEKVRQAILDRTPLPGIGIKISDQPGQGRMITGAPAAAIQAASCPLFAYDASEGDTKKVGFLWGTINGKQPTGFNAGGLPAFTITITETTYFFAAATFDTDTLLTDSVEIIADASSSKDPTSDTAYRLIATALVDGTNLTITGTCGPFTISPCELYL